MEKLNFLQRIRRIPVAFVITIWLLWLFIVVIVLWPLIVAMLPIWIVTNNKYIYKWMEALSDCLENTITGGPPT